MTTAADVHDLYSQLSPRERVALWVEAVANNDAEQTRRIFATCPRYSYSNMADMRFTEAAEQLFSMARDAALWMLRMQYYAALVAGGLAAAKKNDKRLPNATKRLEELQDYVLGYWDAWCDFCKGQGVNPESAIKLAWGTRPPLNDLRDDLGASDEDLERDSDARRLARQQATADLQALWSRVGLITAKLHAVQFGEEADETRPFRN